MENKIKELQVRKQAIANKLDEISNTIRKLDLFARELPGSVLVEPFFLPKDGKQSFCNGYLVVRRNPDAKSGNKDIYVYFQNDLVTERKLTETSLDTKVMTTAYFEEFMEHLVSGLEKKFNITPQDIVAAKIEKPRMCHEGDIDFHNCVDASDCHYWGEDERGNGSDCECYFGETE